MWPQTTADSSAKVHRDGTHRVCPPEQTIERFLPLAGRFGITRLARVTGLDVIGIPVYLAVRPNSRSLSVAQGKGLTDAAAKASALMECIETWHAERVALPLRHESYLSLSREALVTELEQLPRNRGTELSPALPMTFVQGTDLLGGQPLWVPYDLVTTNFVHPAGFRSPFVQSSNGLASGNTLLEATVHALYEVIERDATKLWGYRSPAARLERRLDLEAVTDPGCQSLLQRYRAAGVVVTAWDMTSDLGVPCYSVTIFEDPRAFGWRRAGIYSGYGAHLSPPIALTRALTEAAQSRLTMVSGSRDDLFHADYRHNRNDEDVRAMDEVWRAPGVRRGWDAVVDRSSGSFDGDLQLLLEAVRAAGVKQVAMLDLTRDAGVPVVRVVVPGLEGPPAGTAEVPGPRARRLQEERQ
jgi:YcaO-like protein with predicted kinase domain